MFRRSITLCLLLVIAAIHVPRAAANSPEKTTVPAETESTKIVTEITTVTPNITPVTPAPTKTPDAKLPAESAPAGNAPAANAPAANAPSANAPSANAPAANAPSANAPSENAPSAKATSANAPSANAPSANAPSANAPSANAPSATAPSASSPAANSPSTNAPSANAPEEADNAGKTESKAISLFDECFQSEVKASDLLCSLFDIQNNVTLHEFASGKYFLSTAIMAQTGAADSAANAQLVIRYMKDYSMLNSDFLVNVYSMSMAKYLDKNKKINETNAAELATLYATTMKTVANRTVNEEYPRSKVATLPMAYGFFLNGYKLITAEQAPEIATFYGDEWKYQCEKMGGSKPLPPITITPPKNPMEASDDYCKVESPIVDKFTEAYREAVRASEILSSVFNLDGKMDKNEFSRGVFYMSIYLLQSGGCENTAILADFMCKYVKLIAKLDRTLLVGVHANFMAKFLLSEKYLTEENCVKAAQKYAEITERLAYNIQNPDYPRSNVVAILFSWRDFLLDCKLFSATQGSKIAYYYGNEWFCQTLPAEQPAPKV